MEKRLYTRFKVDVPATFTGDFTGVGTIYNLGLGGCKLASRMRIDQGAILTMDIQIPPPLSPVTIRAAIVRWVIDEEEFGLEFLGIRESERQLLTKFLLTVQ